MREKYENLNLQTNIDQEREGLKSFYKKTKQKWYNYCYYCFLSLLTQRGLKKDFKKIKKFIKIINLDEHM